MPARDDKVAHHRQPQQPAQHRRDQPEEGDADRNQEDRIGCEAADGVRVLVAPTEPLIDQTAPQS